MFTRLADWLVYDLKGLSPDDAFGAALHFFVMDITKIFTMLLILLFLVGLLRSYINNERMKQWFSGKNRFVAYGAAALLGVVTPFCSCSSIPLFIGFVSAGIPLGIAMAFLITSPMVNEVAMLLFGQALGAPFALIYLATGIGTGMVGGFLVDWFGLSRWLVLSAPSEKEGVQGECACRAGVDKEVLLPSRYWRVSYAWQETRFIFSKIWIYVVAGVALGAGMHGYIPQDGLAHYLGHGQVWSVPLAVLAGIPLYANVTGLVPVAEVLIAKGLPVGTTLAFIMATAGLSIPELLILRQVIHWRLLAAFTGYLAGMLIILGYVFNYIF